MCCSILHSNLGYVWMLFPSYLTSNFFIGWPVTRKQPHFVNTTQHIIPLMSVEFYSKSITFLNEITRHTLVNVLRLGNLLVILCSCLWLLFLTVELQSIPANLRENFWARRIYNLKNIDENFDVLYFCPLRRTFIFLLLSLQKCKEL